MDRQFWARSPLPAFPAGRATTAQGWLAQAVRRRDDLIEEAVGPSTLVDVALVMLPGFVGPPPGNRRFVRMGQP